MQNNNMKRPVTHVPGSLSVPVTESNDGEDHAVPGDSHGRRCRSEENAKRARNVSERVHTKEYQTIMLGCFLFVTAHLRSRLYVRTGKRESDEGEGKPSGQTVSEEIHRDPLRGASMKSA